MADKLAAPPLADIGKPDLYWGTWGQGLLSDWWETTPDLIWPSSIITYGRMRHDPQIKAILSALTLPIMRATWTIDPAGCKQEVVQRVADNLGLPVMDKDDEPGPARRRGVIWHRHLRESMFSLIFGHSVFERRYRIDPDGFLALDNLGPRMPWTIASINLYDDGTVKEIRQTTQLEPIPANRLVWYVHQLEGSNWAGISGLRPAFGAWILKHELWKVHATSIRRFGMGVPGVEAPAGATTTQVVEAMNLASSMRVGDSSGVGMPPGYKFSLTGLTGSVPDAQAFVSYLDQQMAKMALAGLIDMPGAVHGSKALGETMLDLFLLSLQAIADEVAETATSGHPGMPGIVTDLVDQNWTDEPAPRVVCTDVGDSHELTAESLLMLAQGGLTPDAELDSWIRKVWKLPQRKTPYPALPGAGGGAPEPGAPGGAPPPQTPPPPPAPVKASAPVVGHRQLTPMEVRAGLDPEAMDSDFQTTLQLVLSSWPQVYRGQRDAIVEEVAAAVDAGNLDRLTDISVDVTAGADLLEQAMQLLANSAASQMIREAAHQGVTIDNSKVTLPDKAMAKVAAARAQQATQWVTLAASRRALQVVEASAGTDVADEVGTTLDGLSQKSAAEQIRAALMAAQNMGRLAAVDAAPADRQASAQWVSVELLDENTCEACAAIDGSVFDTAQDAEDNYPGGGYYDCAGYERCRGTVMVVW
jgi:hypothetical protein